MLSVNEKEILETKVNVLPFILRSYGHVYKVCESEVNIFEMQAYEFANLPVQKKKLQTLNVSICM